MVAAATNIAKSARRRVCAGHGARAMVTLPEVAALLEVTALSKEVLAVPKVLALLEEITAVLEVRTAPSALVYARPKRATQDDPRVMRIHGTLLVTFSRLPSPPLLHKPQYISNSNSLIFKTSRTQPACDANARCTKILCTHYCKYHRQSQPQVVSITYPYALYASMVAKSL